MNGVFFHIAKTSGTSQISVINKYDHVAVNNIFFDQQEILIDTGNTFKWSFVRNPFDRLASVIGAWRWKNINKSIQQILDLVELGHELDWNLPQYPDNIKHTDMFQNTDMAILQHLKPMHKLIEYLSANNINLDFIGKFENLETDWQMIKNKLNIPESLPHLNQSKHYPYQKYFKKQKIIDKTINLYKKDFEYFNYKKEIIS